CRYIDTGDTDSTKTLVACDLTASDVLSSQQDPKQKCREKYGDNVVVHVPVPAGAIVCTPPADGQYAATCSSMPWVVGGAPSGSRRHLEITRGPAGSPFPFLPCRPAPFF